MANRIILYIKSLNEKQKLHILIAITFGLRLYAVLMAQGIANDGAHYGFVAREFLKGNFIEALSSPAPPLYPFLISLLSPGSGHVEIAGRLLSLFFGTLTLIPLFYLIKEAVGRREAIFTALFYSFHPYLVTYSGMLLTEATYWGLLNLSVYFFWTGLRRGKAWRIGLSGVFLSLSYLTRPEGIGYILVYLAWIVIDGILKKRWFKTFVFIGALVTSVFILCIPYVIHIHRETGQWLISKKAVEAQSQLFKKGSGNIEPSKKIEETSPEKKSSKIVWVVQNNFQYFPSVVYHYLRAYHFSLWLFLLFGVIRIRQKGIDFEVFWASMILFHLFSLASFLSSTIRFSIPMVPLSLFWAGAGILEMKRYLEMIKISNPEKVVFGVVLLTVLILLPQSLVPERRHRADQKKIGIWLKQNTPQEAVIMSPRPQEVFYAERKWVMFPQQVSSALIPGKCYQEAIRYAKTKGVRYILVTRHSRETSPDFIEFIQPTDLREVVRRPDLGSILYEVIY